MSEEKLLRERKHIPFAKAIDLGKVLVFVTLVLTEVILVLTNRKYLVAGFEGFYAIFFTIPIAAIHLVSNAIKLFAMRSFRQKIPCYVLDILLLSFLTYVTTGELISIIFVVILSEFYLSQEKFWGNFAMGMSSFVMYLIMFTVSRSLKNVPISGLDMLISSVLGMRCSLSCTFCSSISSC